MDREGIFDFLDLAENPITILESDNASSRDDSTLAFYRTSTQPTAFAFAISDGKFLGATKVS